MMPIVPVERDKEEKNSGPMLISNGNRLRDVELRLHASAVPASVQAFWHRRRSASRRTRGVGVARACGRIGIFRGGGEMRGVGLTSALK